jgi:hypothetical protein
MTISPTPQEVVSIAFQQQMVEFLDDFRSTFLGKMQQLSVNIENAEAQEAAQIVMLAEKQKMELGKHEFITCFF